MELTRSQQVLMDVLPNRGNSTRNDRTYTKSLRQQRKNNNGKIATKSSRNELIKNSEQSSFSLPKTDNKAKKIWHKRKQ